MSYKAVPHLEHADCLEVVTYREKRNLEKLIDSITVECTKCGEIIEELYNASEDNTSPLDVEFPDDDPMLKVHQVAELFAVQAPTVRKMIKDGVLPAVRIDEDKHCRYRLRRSDVEAWMKGKFKRWEDGVKDAARIVQNEMRHKKAIDYPTAKVPIAVFATLNEVELHLAAMLSRGSYESRDTVMQTTESSCCGHAADEAVERDACRVSGVVQERKRWQESLQALEVAAEEADELDGVARGDGIRHAIEFMRGATALPRRGDPQPVPCPDCGGTGSNTAKYPIVGCATCEGDGRLQTNSRWDNHEVQFARLLCEIVATSPVGQNPDIHALAESMDLTPSDVRELFDRAEQVWEKAKAEVK